MADVKVGVGPATIEVPLPTWQWVKGMFRRRDVADQVVLLLRTASLEISRPDEGELRAYLWLVNLSGKEVIPDRVLITYWTWLSRSMPDLPWTVRGLNAPIHRHAIGTLHVATQLNTAAIRTIKESSPTETWRLLQGGLALIVSGELLLRGVERAVRFQLEDQRPTISAYWLTASDSKGSLEPAK